jgi:uncharacterized protein with ATP-grasp and redox domains
MRTNLYCFPCFLRQALEASRMATEDESTHRRVLDSVLLILYDISLQTPPPEIALLVHRRVKAITGNPDPYKEAKRRQNNLALQYERSLSAQIADVSHPLKAALMLSAAGNSIDLAPDCQSPDIYKRCFEMMSRGFAWNDYDVFYEKLTQSKSILFLGDNAGEIVWDKILIEELLDLFDLDIMYAVRGLPILNDVTMEDAEYVGMAQLVKVISNGSEAPGTLLNRCSEEFVSRFRKSDLILSKGQGNYESLSRENRPIFFLLNVKCPVIAQDIHCEIGDIVLKCQSDVEWKAN